MLNKEVDVLILASAGIIRLGFDNRLDLCIKHLDENSFLPAVGQGSVGGTMPSKRSTSFRMLGR